MRAIFFSLVAVNVCLIAWGAVGGAMIDSVASGKLLKTALPKNVPSLELVSESEPVGLASVVHKEKIRTKSQVGPAEVSDAERQGIQVVVPERPLCEMVGVFRVRSDAENFVERLIAIDVKSSVKELELPAGPGYWVYLKPESSRRDALRALGEIQSQGVDSYVIPKGELANGISLGMFSQKKLADARVMEVRALGLAPEIQEIERTYRELWVMLAPGEHKKMSEVTWVRILENFKKIERRQNFCVLDVASDENFL